MRKGEERLVMMGTDIHEERLVMMVTAIHEERLVMMGLKNHERSVMKEVSHSRNCIHKD